MPRSILVGLASIVLGGSACGIPPQHNHLDDVVDGQVFAEMCARVGATPEQVMLVRPGFESYADRIASIESRLQSELESMNVAGVLRSIAAQATARDPEALKGASPAERSRILEETIASRDDPRWDALTARLDLCFRKIEGARVQSESALLEWLERYAVELDLSEPARKGMERFVRRRLLDTFDDEMAGDFDRPVDVLTLVQHASMPHAELDASSLSELDRELFQLDVQDILYRYELALDAALVKNRLDERQRTRHAVSSVALPGDARFDEIERDSTERWHRRYAVSEDAVRDIENVANARLGGNAAVRWRARAYAALCPDLAKSRWPSQMAAWFADLADADPQQLKAVEELQHEYAAAAVGLLKQTIASGVTLRAKRLPVLWSAEKERHILHLAAIHRLSMTYLQRLCSLLTTAQKSRLTEELSRALREDPRSLGPRIGVDDMRAAKISPDQLSLALSCH